METARVKFFIVNEQGGFGFLETPDGDLFFQRNDGGPVSADSDRPEIQTWGQVSEPKTGDIILFGRSTNAKGEKAAPWCFEDDWNAARIKISKRPTYRLMQQIGHSVRGRSKSEEVWQGKTLADIRGMYPHGTEYSGDNWVTHWFERRINGDWERICYDPRYRNRRAS